MSTKLHTKFYNNNRLLLTVNPGEDIAENDPVRVVDAIVEGLDLKDFKKLYKEKGRCPYHPKMMLKIILYAYMNNIYSCRKIEKAVQRDIHYIWLAAQERPDFVTINRFRNRVKKEINNIFTQVVLVLADKGFITLDVEYIDGTKIESKANKYTFVWRKSVEKNRAKLQEKIRVLLGQIDDVIAQDKAAEAPVKPLGVIAVAAGSGQAEILRSLGVDVVVEGGQTMNPSTADILAAAKQARAEQVIVLPNNGNIIMAAQSAAAAADFPMAVVTTRSVPQGFSAMFAFNPTASLEDNAAAMAEVLPGVHDGEITHAVRDSQTVNGDAIHSGDVIGLVDDKVTYVGSDVCDMCVEMVKAMQADIEGDTLTVLAGLDMPQDEFEALVERLEDAVPDLDVDAHRGEQPLYPIVLSIE